MKTTNINIFSKLGLLTMLLTLLLPSLKALANSDNQFQSFGIDTVAGYSTLLSTSKTVPNNDVTFLVKKPDGVIINVSAKSDKTGVAKATLADSYTHLSGKYYVGAKIANATSAVSTFNVFPDQFSFDSSLIVSDKSVAKSDGKDKIAVTVFLKDQFENPFSGHAVSLISSKPDDEILNPLNQNVTDMNGKITFLVSSINAGTSTFSAIDVTSGKVLSSKVQVAFLDNDFYLTDAGGSENIGFTSFNDGFADIFQVAQAQQFGSVNNFDITDLPDPVNLNKDISFKVTARDQNNVTVQNYTGTIHFSADGDNSANVTLPEDYTFKAEDLGEHQFSLGLKFTANGTYKIVVTDINNQLVKSDKVVIVGGGQNQLQNSGQKPLIVLPSSGSYSQNIQTVSGSAPNGSMVNIFDNDLQIGTVQTSPGGVFTFQTGALADGSHKLYAVAVNLNNAILGSSDTVQISIDTTPPSVDGLEISPTSGITANSVMSVKVVSEDSLQSASVVINSNIIQLTPSLDQSENYVGSMQAPAEAGVYPIDVVLVDQLGNQGNFKAKATVTITADGGTVTTQESIQTTETTQETVQTQPMETDSAPSQVIGVVAYGSDHRVTLVWEPATDDKVITNYRIFYGLDSTNLDQYADTKDFSTTWYVPNLDNGKEYYFAVTAVDDHGQESSVKSEIASAIPFNLEVNIQVPDKPTDALAVNGYEEVLLKGAAVEGLFPPRSSEEGPEILWLLAGSGAVSGLIRKFRGKKK